MKKIIEIIPNYSEGKNLAIMEEIISPFKKAGIFLCLLEMDKDYNRSVVTIIGEVDTVIVAMAESALLASKLIDLNHQSGEHPRIGAVDVIPIVPIRNVNEEDCQEAVIRLAELISSQAKIPVYLYNKSATSESRKLLPNIRKGEFEGLELKMKNSDWFPDYGESKPHPQAGAVAIGVREPLIAYNIDLNTSDKMIAEKIARKIRFSSGGLPFVQAKAALLRELGNAQVTINLTDYHKTSLAKVFKRVEEEARRLSVKIVASEIIGLIPQEALQLSLQEIDCQFTNKSIADTVKLSREYFLLRNFSQEKILDYYLDKILGEEL